MAKKTRAKATPAQVTLAQLQAEPRRAVIAARRAGGVPVVDEQGQTLFSLWMPADPVPGWRG